MRKRQSKFFPYVLAPDGLSAVCNSFDIVGDIAIIKLPAPPLDPSIIASAILARHKNVKTVLAQSSPVVGNYRIRKLIHVAGENKTRTVHKESGCMFAVNLDACYFSPRLSYERRRITQLVKPAETVVNMFAGVGCFSILIAKYVPAAKVYSIDVNPAAVHFMVENIQLNKIPGNMFPLLGDSKLIVETQLQGAANRVLMPLPEKALEYLPSAIAALKSEGGWIHYHSFEHATKEEKPCEKAKQKLVKTLSTLNVDFEVPLLRVVRRIGPNWHHVVADIRINRLTNLNNAPLNSLFK